MSSRYGDSVNDQLYRKVRNRSYYVVVRNVRDRILDHAERPFLNDVWSAISIRVRSRVWRRSWEAYGE